MPLQRFSTESELASAAVFLLSDASAFINGTVIRMNGGVPNVRHSWPLANAERITEYNGFPPATNHLKDAKTKHRDTLIAEAEMNLEGRAYEGCRSGL
ncbi:SDR family oxidoreductase [Paraburkholderia sp.]|uniref:SDR family oxidoreductase n=1 Tax=Paraburkholderia sp. TaxID=1926495 RepID=UPI003C7DDDF2